jgi:hypothetical protein
MDARESLFLILVILFDAVNNRGTLSLVPAPQ